MAQNTRIIRNLLREVKDATLDKSVRNSIIGPYIINLCRKFQVTDAQLCRKKDEMVYLADTYRCYLESSRKYKELCEKYQGKGERSIKQTADMVGFKLPHDPK